MTPRQIELVRSTFALLAPAPDYVAALFYQRLFHIDPALRPLFKSDLRSQGQKLMQMLAAAVAGLDHIDALLPTLHQLGARHAGYGVTAAHYDTVGAALVGTLENGLGRQFTAEVRAAWIAAYTAVAGAMQDGAAAQQTRLAA